MSEWVGRSCKRLPSGRICKVIDWKTGYVKVHDPGARWKGWIAVKVFLTQWGLL